MYYDLISLDNMDRFLLRQTQMKQKLGLRNGQWDRSASYKEAVDAKLAAWTDMLFDRWESTHSQVTLLSHLTVVETALLETSVQNMTKTTFLLMTTCSDNVLPIIKHLANFCSKIKQYFYGPNFWISLNEVMLPSVTLSQHFEIAHLKQNKTVLFLLFFFFLIIIFNLYLNQSKSLISFQAQPFLILNFHCQNIPSLISPPPTLRKS